MAIRTKNKHHHRRGASPSSTSSSAQPTAPGSSPSSTNLSPIRHQTYSKTLKQKSPITTIKSQSNSDDSSADASDRIISAVCYFYPPFDGVQYVRKLRPHRVPSHPARRHGRRQVKEWLLRDAIAIVVWVFIEDSWKSISEKASSHGVNEMKKIYALIIVIVDVIVYYVGYLRFLFWDL